MEQERADHAYHQITYRERAVFTTKVRALRVERNWTIPEFAERARLALSTARDIDRGGITPQIRTVKKVATAFEVSDWRSLITSDQSLPVIEKEIERFSGVQVISRDQQAILAVNVKRLRTQRGWTPTMLAEKIGVWSTTISDIEKSLGRSRISTVKKIAAVFDCQDWENLVNDTSRVEDTMEVPLVAQLTQGNYNSYAATTQQQLDSYRREIDELQATLDLIRTDVGEALNSRYAPSTSHLAQLLYPALEDIRNRAAEFAVDREKRQ